MTNDEVFDRLIGHAQRPAPARPAHLRLNAEDLRAKLEAKTPGELRQLTGLADEAHRAIQRAAEQGAPHRPIPAETAPQAVGRHGVTAEREPSDAELIVAVRGGDTSAYGLLYVRHLHAAKRAAASLANTPAEREDLVADAFARVLGVLREGRGPNEEFRAYLLVTMRNAAISRSRQAAENLYTEVPETTPQETGDPIVKRWDTMNAAAAFASLPERWRTVLWHTEVENETPADVAPPARYDR